MPHFIWNDHKIFYRKQGEGPLLLIFPGQTATSICHQGEMEYFSDRFCAASLDFLGTGQSDRIAQWLLDWWVQAARQAHGLMQHLDYPECIAMGTSGGAVVALLMAILYPECVKAVIADSFSDKVTRKPTLEYILADRNVRSREQVGFWKYAQGKDWQQVIDADTDLLVRFVEAGGDWFSGRLAEIQCPVLITGSRQDAVYPQIADNAGHIAEQIPDCRIFLGDKGDHPFMWTGPAEFRKVGDVFLKEIISR